jgi:hypothetical protein
VLDLGFCIEFGALLPRLYIQVRYLLYQLFTVLWNPFGKTAIAERKLSAAVLFTPHRIRFGTKPL